MSEDQAFDGHCPTCGQAYLGAHPAAEAEILHLVRYWFHYNGLTAIPEWALEKLRAACAATLAPLDAPDAGEG